MAVIGSERPSGVKNARIRGGVELHAGLRCLLFVPFHLKSSLISTPIFLQIISCFSEKERSVVASVKIASECNFLLTNFHVLFFFKCYLGSRLIISTALPSIFLLFLN